MHPDALLRAVRTLRRDVYLGTHAMLAHARAHTRTHAHARTYAHANTHAHTHARTLARYPTGEVVCHEKTRRQMRDGWTG
eukprot:5231297-Pleurochrysis_carterae.AAC.1